MATSLVSTVSGATAAPQRERVRSHPAPLAVAFAACLFVFPSAVVLAGPLNSNGHPLRLVGLVALVVLCLDLLRRRTEVQARPQVVAVLLVLYVVQALFFYGWRLLDVDVDPAGELRTLLFALSACGMALYTALRVTALRTVTGVVAVLVAGCSLNAVVGILQAVGAPLSWVDVVALPGFQVLDSARGVGERAGLVRAIGTAGHPIEFAVVLGCCLPFAMHLALHARTSRGKQAALAAAAAMALSVPFALSRGGLICITVSVVVFLVVQTWSTRLTTAAAALAAACVAYVLVPATYSAVVSLFTGAEDDPSITGRTDDLPVVDAAFNAAPFLGGAPVPAGLILDNQWFGTLVARGLVGVGALALLFLVPAVSLLATAWRVRRTDPERQSMAAALAGCVLAVGVSGAVFDLLSFGTAAMLLFLVVGLSAAVVRGGAPQPASARSGSTGSPPTVFPGPRGTLFGPSTSP
jgi:hypothetical protein